MSYKIIQQASKKGYTLTIIPEALEHNGVFWYPPINCSTIKRNKIIKNPYEQPDKTNWMARPCVVKRSKIKSYSMAEQIEEELLSTYMTTEDDMYESDCGTPTGTTCNRFKNPNVTRSPQPNFDLIAESMTTAPVPTVEAHKKDSKISAPSKKVLSTSNIVLLEENFIEDNPEPSETDIQTTDITDIMYQLLENQRTIIENQVDIKNNINNGFLKLYTQIENLVKGGVLEPINKNNNNKENNQFSTKNFKKIATVDDAKCLDDLLSFEENMNLMVAQMAYVVGKNGNRCGEGWTCCYELVDTIFLRSFLVRCSWTGASTSNEDGKVAFLTFKNIIMCFAKIIICADPNFSIAATQQFFKSLLRNATRFLTQEKSQKRKSSGRNRSKQLDNKKSKLETQVEIEATVIDDENEMNRELNKQNGVTIPVNDEANPVKDL